MDNNWERKADLQKHKVDEDKQEDIQLSGGSVSVEDIGHNEVESVPVEDIGPDEEESTRPKEAEKKSNYCRLGARL